MTRRLLLVLLLLGLMPTLQGAEDVTFETLTVANASIGLTSTTYSPAGRAPMLACQARLETAQIRYRFDGSDPTSTVGTILEVGEVLEIASHADARRMRFIRTGAVSGALQVHCWR